MKKPLRIFLITGSILLLLFLVGIGGFVIWALNPLGPGNTAITALENTDQLRIEKTEQGWYKFEPTEAASLTGQGNSMPGFIFYPGGRVDFRSYAGVLSRIAELGFPVFLVPAPLNLMVLGSNRAARVMGENPEIESWVVGGHSLGAAMAANFAYKNPDLISQGLLKGLVLWAGYSAETWDLSKTDLQVLSISAENDRVFNRELYEQNKILLPSSTQFLEIKGGNHAGFGDYGNQPGDGPLTIPPIQQEITTAALTGVFLSQVGK